MRWPDGAPTIAVSTGFTDYGDYLGLALSRPLVAAGAAPVVLPYLEDERARERALDRADGLLLGFGRDLEPARYAAGPHRKLTDVSPHRDEFELAIADAALRRGMPLLGICRGMQVLNVLRGGTLYRDRSEYPPPARAHPGGDWATWDRVCAATLGRGPMPEHPNHPVTLEPGSRLAAALGRRARVNSYHHQAVRDLGDAVEAVAWADDGIVEAIELPAAPAPVLGVQWELQESWKDDHRFLRIFADFVDAAGRHGQSRQAPGRARRGAPYRVSSKAPGTPRAS